VFNHLFKLAQRLAPLIGLAAWLVLAAGLYWSLVKAPADYYQGEVARLMNLHVPLAKTSLAAYSVAFIASIAYLWKRAALADQIAHASIAVGIVFTGCTLMSGSIWGKPTWNAWWTWDARLVSFAVMFLMMAGYLMLRTYVDDPERQARFAAVLALVGFIDLPVIHLSVRWWRTLHQPASFKGAGGIAIAPEMLTSLALMAAGMMLLFTYLTLLYTRRLQLQAQLEQKQRQQLMEFAQ